jgi:plasmid stability protein
MAQVHVRNLDDVVVRELRERAVRHGRSLEAELRELLTAEALRPRREIAAELDRLEQVMRSEDDELFDSTAWIRQERERIG